MLHWNHKTIFKEPYLPTQYDCKDKNKDKAEKAALAQHRFNTRHTFNWDEVKIINTRAQFNYSKRLISEVIHTSQNNTKNNIQVIPAPEPLSVSLDLAIFILSESDIDKYMNSQLQMKQYPEDTLELDISNMNTKSTEHLNLQEKSTINQLSNETTQSQRLRNVQKPNEEDITEEKFLRKTVECLIANVIFSDYFHEILKQSNQVPPPFYCQFTMTKDDVKHGTSKTYLCPEEQIRLRNEKVTEFFTRPKSVQLANLVDQLIYDGIHECFKLGTRLETEENINTYVKESIRLCGENCKCKHKYANI